MSEWKSPTEEHNKMVRRNEIDTYMYINLEVRIQSLCSPYLPYYKYLPGLKDI